MAKHKLHFAGTPSEIIERLMKAFEGDDEVRAALAGMLDPDNITSEWLKHEKTKDIRGSTFFSVLIALNALTQGVDKVKSFIDMAIRSDGTDEDDRDHRQGENLSYIAQALNSLSRLDTEEYKDLRDWLHIKAFGKVLGKGEHKVVPMNSDGIEEAFTDHDNDTVTVNADSDFLESVHV